MDGISINGVEDPIHKLKEMAIGIHSMFEAYVDAGFSESQAIKLIAEFLAASTRGNNE